MKRSSAKFRSLKMKVKRRSPEICLCLGLIMGGVTVVTSCRSTLKAKKIVDQAKAELENINKIEQNPETMEENEFEKNDIKQAKNIVMAQTGVDILKTYAAPIIFGSLSVWLITKGHRIQYKRGLALAAGCKVANEKLKTYRKRVVEKFGEAADLEMLTGGKVDTETIINDDGTKEQFHHVTLNDKSEKSPYIFYMDSSNPNWQKQDWATEAFINAQEDLANNILTSNLKGRNFVSLKDVLDLLSIEPTKDSLVLGWIYDSKNPVGDNHISFRTTKLSINGELVYMFDFNCDGNIYDML